MARFVENRSAGLPARLSELAHEFQLASGADMIALTLLDDSTRTYYAPVVLGQPEEGLTAALADQTEQLGRYDTDRAQGKAPDDLHVRQYGPSAWLAVVQKPLIAPNAPAEVDSTFVRRHRIASMIGLPLLDHHRYLGHVYLNYCSEGQPSPPDPRLPEGERLRKLEDLAADAAHRIADALSEDERAALNGSRRLAQLLATPAADDEGGGPALRRRFAIALSELLYAIDEAAAAVYRLSAKGDALELFSAQAPIAVPLQIPVPKGAMNTDEVALAALREAARNSGLHPVIAQHLVAADQDPSGFLVVLSRDPLAPIRWSPPTRCLLGAAADLMTGALACEDLVGDLERSNRLLGALSKMTTTILRPGASRQQVLEAVAQRLTDASAPEFDFDFATVTLIGPRPDGGLDVRGIAGASTVETIRSQAIADGATSRRGTRVPVWALTQERPLMSNDVLAYTASNWQTVVVGPEQPDPNENAAVFLEGYSPEQMRTLRVPVERRDGEVVQQIPVVLIGESSPVEVTGEEGPPFTLDAEIFVANRHGELIRIFLPFGLDARSRATGVLEVGYQVGTGKLPSRRQVEALRAAGSQIAVAVDTARLYEEARRHAEQLEIASDVSKAISSSIDLDQTLRLVARNLTRLVDASLCQIALYDEDTSGWYGAADSTGDRRWMRLRGERTQHGMLFEALERGQPLVIEDAGASEMVPEDYKKAFQPRSMMVVPLLAGEEPVGAAILTQQDRRRRFRPDEVALAQNLGHQSATAIKNARLHALAEEEHHIQKDFVLVGFGMWGQKAYEHLLTLKQFFNFRIHIVERAEARERLGDRVKEIHENGDAIYWDSEDDPGHEQLEQALETSCYVITYIATPASKHLAALARYYSISDVIMIEKPLGASPEAYRSFLDTVPGGVELIAADHYYFKLEVRLFQLLLTEERTLREFMDTVEEVRVEILEAKPLTGAAAEIGVVADLIPHAFAIVSLLAPIDRITLDPDHPLEVGRHEPFGGERETYARMRGTFPHHGRTVRLVIDVGKGVDDQKWIKVSGEPPSGGGRANFYKFDFGRGEAIDGTQGNVRSAVRKIREPGVPDNAHLTMLRHLIEKRHPAVGILTIREAIRSNMRIQELEGMALRLLREGNWTSYKIGTRPSFAEPAIPVVDGVEPQESLDVQRERARHA